MNNTITANFVCRDPLGVLIPSTEKTVILPASAIPRVGDHIIFIYHNRGYVRVVDVIWDYSDVMRHIVYANIVVE